MSRAAHLLAALTLVSRVGGLSRDVAVSAVFGTSAGADAFFVAFRIPNLLRRVVGEGASSAALVPVFTDSLIRGGPAAAARAAGAVGGAAFLVLAALTLVGMAAAEPLTAAFAPGFARDAAKQAMTATLTRWTFPYLILVGAAAWAMGVLHTHRRFALPALGPLLLNLAIIACVVWLAPHLRSPEYALVAGVLIGGLLQFLVQVPALHGLGLRPAMLANLSDPALRRTRALVVPVVFGGAVYQINILVATVFASLLPNGSVSYLWYADRIFEFPLGVVAVAVGTAALPSLAAQAKAGQTLAMADTVAHSLGLVLAFCVPAAVGLALLAPDIVAVLLQRGRFSPQDAAMTTWALRAYLPGLLGVAVVRVLAAAFYAVERPRVPVYAAMLALLVNAFFDVALMGPVDLSGAAADWWGAGWIAEVGAAVSVVDLRHAGLALAAGIAATVNAVVLLVLLRRRLPQLPLAPVGRSATRHAAAALAMAAAIVALQSALRWASQAPAVPVWAYGPAPRLALSIAVGGAVYAACAIALGSVEVRELVGMIRARGGRTLTRAS
ncbi:MAG: murein biosynthesis integral membrane protein MurJ [Deltaproteobacteria bacterium]|nr:murein biosynthesis integral membrane protein MurJ [Deltaproteobacteria bacterium]